MTDGKISRNLLCAAVVGCLALGACNTIYLHSDADQKAMEKGQEGYAASKTKQLEALAAHEIFITDTIAQSRFAVVKEQLALRDGDVSSLLSAEDWQSAIGGMVESRVKNLTGETSLPDAQLAGGGSSMSFAAFIITLTQQRLFLAKQAGILRDASSSFEGLGGRIKRPCGVQGSGIETDPPAGVTGGADPLTEQAARVHQLCSIYETMRASAIGQYAPTSSQPPLVACMLGDGDACRGAGDSRRQFPAYDILAELNDVELLIENTRKLQSAVEAHLDELAEVYACALEAENAPDASERVQAAAQLVRDFVAILPETDLALSEKVKVAASAAPLGAPAVEPCPNKPAEALTFAGLLARAGVKPEDLATLLSGLADLDAGKAIVAGLAKAKTDFAQSQLATILVAVAAPPAGTSAGAQTDQPAAPGTQDKAALVAASMVAALGPIERIIEVRQNSLPDTRAVLVQLAAARYEATLAGVQLAQLQKTRELLRLQADATLRQLTMLGRAKSTTRRVAAIYDVGESWNSGAIPAAAAAVDLRGLRYTGWEAEERLAVVANYDSLQPLLDELQIYANGGFTADDIAKALSTAALVGIAVGVN